MIRGLVTGFGFQVWVLRRSFGEMNVLVTAPLTTLVFLAITRHAGRADLAPYAVLAPALIVLWGTALTIWHPVAFVAAAAVTALAMAGTASIMAALFVLARSARAFQNSLNYPFYVLGGVMVPVALLPGAAWLEPISRMVFLSWSADLLRDTLSPAAVPDLLPRLGVVLSLGMAGYLLGLVLLRRATDRLRRTGTMGYA